MDREENMINQKTFNVKKIMEVLSSQHEIGVVIALIVIAIFFSITTKTFMTSLNLLNILRQAALVGIMAVPVTLLIISQEFDLSVGSIFGAVPISFTVIMEYGLSIWTALPIALLIGPFFGLINGVLTTKMKIPSFITTLGTLMIYRGVALVVGGGYPRTLAVSNWLTFVLGGGTLFGFLQMPIIWLLLITAVGITLLQKTSYGFKVFATGGNVQAAKVSGINTDRIKITNFINISHSQVL